MEGHVVAEHVECPDDHLCLEQIGRATSYGAAEPRIGVLEGRGHVPGPCLRGGAGQCPWGTPVGAAASGITLRAIHGLDDKVKPKGTAQRGKSRPAVE